MIINIVLRDDPKLIGVSQRHEIKRYDGYDGWFFHLGWVRLNVCVFEIYWQFLGGVGGERGVIGKFLSRCFPIRNGLMGPVKIRKMDLGEKRLNFPPISPGSLSRVSFRRDLLPRLDLLMAFLFLSVRLEKFNRWLGYKRSRFSGVSYFKIYKSCMYLWTMYYK